MSSSSQSNRSRSVFPINHKRQPRQIRVQFISIINIVAIAAAEVNNKNSGLFCLDDDNPQKPGHETIGRQNLYTIASSIAPGHIHTNEQTNESLEATTTNQEFCFKLLRESSTAPLTSRKLQGSFEIKHKKMTAFNGTEASQESNNNNNNNSSNVKLKTTFSSTAIPSSLVPNLVEANKVRVTLWGVLHGHVWVFPAMMAVLIPLMVIGS